jgi:hypothetical protein
LRQCHRLEPPQLRSGAELALSSDARERFDTIATHVTFGAHHSSASATKQATQAQRVDCRQLCNIPSLRRKRCLVENVAAIPYAGPAQPNHIACRKAATRPWFRLVSREIKSGMRLFAKRPDGALKIVAAGQKEDPGDTGLTALARIKTAILSIRM